MPRRYSVREVALALERAGFSSSDSKAATCSTEAYGVVGSET